MDAAEVIREAFKRAGIKSDLAISNELGMEYKRLHFRRLNDIGSLTLAELWLMQRHGCFTDEDLLQIVKEGGEQWQQDPKTNRTSLISYAKP